jgi:hypothetical protein
MIYFFITSGASLSTLKGLVMALAYCWGLILAIYLMGHGLVSVPRKLFRNASVSGKLRRIQANAPKVHEKMEERLDLRKNSRTGLRNWLMTHIFPNHGLEP